PGRQKGSARPRPRAHGHVPGLSVALPLSAHLLQRRPRPREGERGKQGRLCPAEFPFAIVCIDDFATFNAELNEQLIQDMQRPHYEKNRLIAELWEEDRERLLMLPNSPFEAVQLETALA